MTCIIRAYVPNNTDATSIEKLMLGHGGYTTFKAHGNWIDQRGKEIREPIKVYECVVDTKPKHAAMQIDHAGRMFLNNNSEEQSFLGQVISRKEVATIYIKQGE